MTFYERDDNGINKTGTSLRNIYLDVKNRIKIICEPYFFFYLPAGIKSENGQVLRTSDKILQKYELPGINDFEFSQCLFASHSFELVENHFDVSISVWTKTNSRKLSYADYECKRVGTGFRSCEINLHYQKEINSFVLIHVF